MLSWVRNEAQGILRVLMAGVVAAALLTSSWAIAAEQKEKQEPLSPEISKILKQAQEAQGKNDFDTMMTLSKQAMEQAKKPNDIATAAHFVQNAAVSKKDWDSYAEAAEKLLTIPEPTVGNDERIKLYKALVQIYTQKKDYDKALPNAEKWAEVGNGGSQAYDLITQIYLIKKDCPNAMAALDKSINGAAPTEQQLNWQLRCAVDTNDLAKQKTIVEQLVALHPTRDAVMNELKFASGKDVNPTSTMNVLRFAFFHNYLESAAQFNIYADLAQQAGAVEEAQAVLDRGVSKGVVAADPKVNHQLGEVRRLAAEDKKSLPQLDKDARAGSNGQADVAVGTAYFGLGQYDKAAEALARGLQPDRVGKVKHVDDANMLLGICYLMLNRLDDAKKAFDNVHGDEHMQAMAKAWVASGPLSTSTAAAPAATSSSGGTN